MCLLCRTDACAEYIICSADVRVVSHSPFTCPPNNSIVVSTLPFVAPSSNTFELHIHRLNICVGRAHEGLTKIIKTVPHVVRVIVITVALMPSMFAWMRVQSFVVSSVDGVL